MCARYTLHQNLADLVKRFGVKETLKEDRYRLDYNVAINSPIAVISSTDCNGVPRPRTLTSMLWGMWPSWWKKSSPLFNFQMETMRDKPTFKGELRRRRCIFAVDGFYEWRTATDGSKQPFLIRRNDGVTMGFAGIWHVRAKDGEDGASMGTCTPNELMETIHNRMPCILRPEDEDEWLEAPEAEAMRLIQLLAPYSAKAMEAFPVSPRVNKVGYNEPDCIEPLIADAV